MSDKEKIVLDTIFTRRSIRQFIEGKVIEDKKIKKLLEAAMAAPSACNLQPWEFIVVTKKESLDNVNSAMMNRTFNAPLAVIVCANTKNIPWEGNGWMIDCAASVMNMMTAAVAMDLGSVWIGSHQEDKIRKLFEIPDNIKVMSIVYFGYPDETAPAGTRYAEDAVFNEIYDPSRVRNMRTMEMLPDRSVKTPEI